MHTSSTTETMKYNITFSTLRLMKILGLQKGTGEKEKSPEFFALQPKRSKEIAEELLKLREFTARLRGCCNLRSGRPRSSEEGGLIGLKEFHRKGENCDYPENQDHRSRFNFWVAEFFCSTLPFIWHYLTVTSTADVDLLKTFFSSTVWTRALASKGTICHLQKMYDRVISSWRVKCNKNHTHHTNGTSALTRWWSGSFEVSKMLQGNMPDAFPQKFDEVAWQFQRCLRSFDTEGGVIRWP